jgi:hypothetical protein
MQAAMACWKPLLTRVSSAIRSAAVPCNMSMIFSYVVVACVAASAVS